MRVRAKLDFWGRGSPLGPASSEQAVTITIPAGNSAATSWSGRCDQELVIDDEHDSGVSVALAGGRAFVPGASLSSASGRSRSGVLSAGEACVLAASARLAEAVLAAGEEAAAHEAALMSEREWSRGE